MCKDFEEDKDGADMTSRKPLGAGEIEVQRATIHDGGELCPSGSGELAVLSWDDYQRLLSMLTPPSGAEVRHE